MFQKGLQKQNIFPELNSELVKKSKISQSGFTLLEILLAVTLSSIILTALYSTFFMSVKAINRMDDYLIRLQEIREIMDSLRKEIESTIYLKDNEYTNFKVVDKDEFGKQVSGLYLTTFAGFGNGFKNVSYYVNSKDEKLKLFKTIEPAFTDEEVIDIEIIEEIEEFNIDVNNKGVVTKTWDTEFTKKLPQSIEVSITVVVREEEITLSETIYPKIEVG